MDLVGLGTTVKLGIMVLSTYLTRLVLDYLITPVSDEFMIDRQDRGRLTIDIASIKIDIHYVPESEALPVLCQTPEVGNSTQDQSKQTMMDR